MNAWDEPPVLGAGLPKPNNWQDVVATLRARTAAERARKLEPRLVRLRVIVQTASGVEPPLIELDGSPLSTALLETPFFVDPGTHDIRARAQGRKPWETSVTADTAAQVLDVTIPELAPDEPPVVEPAPEGPATSASLPVVPKASQSEPTHVPAPTPAASTMHDGGTLPKPGLGTLILGGTGIVALAVAGGYGVSSWIAWTSAKDQGCAGGHCPTPQAQARSASAGTQADIATGGVVVGGVLLATATAIYFLSDARSDAAPRAARRLAWDAMVSRDRVATTLVLSF